MPVNVESMRAEDVDEIVKKIIGKNGENTRYISEETKAHVHVRSQGGKGKKGKSKEPIEIQIKAPDNNSLDHAVELVDELVSTILEEMQEESPKKRQRWK